MHRPARLATLLVFACLVGGVIAPSAHAQRGRPSAAQRKKQQEAARKAQEQMRAYQADVARYQREMAARQAEVEKRFDENADGRLFGVERSKYTKYVEAVRTGRETNPFADIKPPGQGAPATPAAKPEAKK